MTSYVRRLLVFSGSPLTVVVIPELAVHPKLASLVLTIYVTLLFIFVVLNDVSVVNPNELVVPVLLSLTRTSYPNSPSDAFLTESAVSKLLPK